MLSQRIVSEWSIYLDTPTTPAPESTTPARPATGGVVWRGGCFGYPGAPETTRDNNNNNNNYDDEEECFTRQAAKKAWETNGGIASRIKFWVGFT